MTVLTAVLQSLYNYGKYIALGNNANVLTFASMFDLILSETIRRNLQKPRLKEPEWQLLEKLLEDLYEGRVRLQSQVERMSHVLILPAGDVQQHAKNLIHDAFWIFNMFGNQAKSTFATVSKSEAEEMSGDWSIQTDSSTNPTGLGS